MSHLINQRRRKILQAMKKSNSHLRSFLFVDLGQSHNLNGESLSLIGVYKCEVRSVS